MKATHIGIIGMGPRGLSVLERMAEQMRGIVGSVPLVLHLIDTNACGQGSHSSRQADYLLTNTVAAQVGMFEPNSFVGGVDGISLTQWARQAGYRKFGTRFFQVADQSGEVIGDHDYLPRKVLGEYLSWVYEQVLQALPGNVSVRYHRRNAVDVRESEHGLEVELDNGFVIRTDYVFLTTGHGKRAPNRSDHMWRDFVDAHGSLNPRLDYFASPYPIEGLSKISPQATVAIQGLGLTAYDVITELTTGRGGKFVGDERRLRYQASGFEPRIALVSRNCLPFAARGINQKGIAGCYQATFFTVDAVRKIRVRTLAQTGSPQIDFVRDVLPLIEKEMAYAYRSAQLGSKPDAHGFVPSDEEKRAIARLLRPLDGLSFESFAQFRSFFIDSVEADLIEAFKGNVDSPVKAASDSLRDTREALRCAVEFRGLTPASHRIYVEDFVATTNRISFGPPKLRNVELLALIDAGILDIAGGPGCTVSAHAGSGKFIIENHFAQEKTSLAADVLVVARLDYYSPLTDSSPLSKNLLAGGVIRLFMNGDYHCSGLDIDEKMRPLRADGTVHTRLWAIGYPVEGAHFYTHALPRPLMQSRFTADAHQCVEQLLADIGRAAAQEMRSAARPENSGGDLGKHDADQVAAQHLARRVAPHAGSIFREA